MLDNQLLIKIILIAVFVVFAIVLLAPVKGARRLALRRIVLLAAFAAAVFAVAFPNAINDIANVLGVGRGTDLVLYGLVVVFIGNAITTSAHNRQLQREITQLARAVALGEAGRPRS
jgi:hypothetical protein